MKTIILNPGESITIGTVAESGEKTFSRLLVEMTRPSAVASSGKERTFWNAFSKMVGKDVTEVVKAANLDTTKEFRITADEFRHWLPDTLSAIFAKAYPR